MLAPHQKEIIEALKSESTWRLVFLSIITLGIYTAFYIKRQSRALNEYLTTPGHRIKEGFIQFILVIAFVSAAIDVVDLIYGEDDPTVAAFSAGGDMLFGLSVIFWAFMMCTRLNYLLGAAKRTPLWSSKLWAFLFGALYINYKVNTLWKRDV
ncbi:MAG: DUF4234 domain-containing protein [Alphaproteobacteria bacterium]|nr:DUF4234 domain-containing protein [Alphaproteobacteria bacterium]